MASRIGVAIGLVPVAMSGRGSRRLLRLTTRLLMKLKKLKQSRSKKQTLMTPNGLLVMRGKMTRMMPGLQLPARTMHLFLGLSRIRRRLR